MQQGRLGSQALQIWIGDACFMHISAGLEAVQQVAAPDGGHGSGADRIVGAIRPGVRRGDADYAAMT